MAENDARARREIDVQKVAALARLTLTDEETRQFEPQLRAVLGHITQLDALDTTGIEATSHGVPMGAPLRDDAVKPGLARDEALAAAPRSAEGAFVVPRFVESG